VNYGITFPMFAKTSVIGRKANPLFRELAARTGNPPRWNFHKYLLDQAGQAVAVFESAVEPENKRITPRSTNCLLRTDRTDSKRSNRPGKQNVPTFSAVATLPDVKSTGWLWSRVRGPWSRSVRFWGRVHGHDPDDMGLVD